MKIALIGATGLVGRKVIEVLEKSELADYQMFFVGSQKSYNKTIFYKEKKYKIMSIDEVLHEKPQISIFSAGSEVSLEYAEKFAQAGSFVVDNSSAWRMDNTKKLIVPEINGDTLTKNDKIIANPNCSTIQLVMALAPLHRKYEIKRVIVSTYQSVTGSGAKAVNQLRNERSQLDDQKFYPHKIDLNLIPHCDIFLENDYTKEEMKLVNETKKILNAPNIMLSATAVRVPVVGGHSESVNVEFENDFEIDEVKKILSETKGVVVLDDVKNNVYPMPKDSHNKDEVFVGRIRKDISRKKALNLWIVADNLRKGAATNAVQIAEIIKNFI